MGIYYFLKKVFSLALIFFALLTIACAVEILSDRAWFDVNWQPFFSFFLSGATCFAVIALGILNCYPSKDIARNIHTKRLFFHHYVWGLMVIFAAVVYLFFFSPIPVLQTFLVYSTDLAVNAGRFTILIGATLFIDDLPDTSKHIQNALAKLKKKSVESSQIFHWLQILTGIIVLSTVIVSAAFIVTNPESMSVPTVILLLPMCISSIISIILFKRKGWLTIE